MNTILGFSFLRVVSEEGGNGWAQVFARIPFDESELENKGALLGVVRGKESKEWADIEAELTEWVEECFNKAEKGGMLLELEEAFTKKYTELNAVWVWMTVEGGKRLMRVTKTGNCGLTLIRKDNRHEITGNIEDGKVIKGEVTEGDTILIWTEEIKRYIDDAVGISESSTERWNKELKENNVAGAGLVLNIGGVELEKEIEKEILVENVAEEMVAEKREIPEGVVEDQEIVGNRLVGPIGIKEKIVNFWNEKIRKERGEVLIVRDRSKRKRNAATLGIVFLVLLVISLAGGSVKSKEIKERKRWEEFSSPIEKNRQEAVTMTKINPTGAKKLMEDVKNSFAANKMEFENGKYKMELAELEKKINDSWTETSGEKESVFEEVVNLELLRQGIMGSRMSWIKGGQMLVMDASMGVVMSADTKTKELKVVAGKGEGQGWIDSVSDGKETLMLKRVGLASSLKEQMLMSFDAAVLDPVAVSLFGSNLYVLDGGNKEIFKYPRITEGLGERVRWLKQDEVMSIIPVDMAIDADLWAVSESGQVEKFRRGVKEVFALSGMPAGVKISRIAVEQTGEKLAVLDKTMGRIIYCNKKSGACSLQMKSEKLLMAKDIEFDEEGNLFVLIGGKIGRLK